MKKRLITMTILFIIIAIASSGIISGKTAFASASSFIPPTEISTNQAKARIKKIFGKDADKIISHMIYRFPAPKTYQHTGIHADNYLYYWSGYQAQRYQDDIETAEGYFTARQSIGGLDYTWVGVGGVNKNLIQTGVIMNYHVNGQIMPFWEEAPQMDAQPLSWAIPIGTGDTMFALVDSASPGEWTILIEDYNTGAYSYFGEPYNADQTGAEWIVEQDLFQSRGNLDESVNFTSCEWGNASSMNNINSSNDSYLYKPNLTNPPFNISPIGADGQSFTISNN